MSRRKKERATDDDVIDRFVRRVDLMEANPLVIEGALGTSLNFSFKAGESLGVTSTGPAEGPLRVLLQDLRPCFSAGEAIYMPTVWSLLERGLSDARLAADVRSVREHWKATLRGAIALNINDQDYRAEQILDAWMNGLWFHDDPQKLATLKELAGAGPFAQILTRHSRDNMIIDVLRLARVTGNIARRALDHHLLA